MIDRLNEERHAHIITIEDPIEYNFTDNKSIIDQREIGIDTEDFFIALRAATREDPDVIMVGEMRDKETILAAITAAITGHLVLTTLHTTNVVQTINRIIEYYPSDMQQQVRIMLSQTIQAVISMRLLPRIGGGRIPALEIMIATARIREFIQDPEKTELIKTAMEEGEYDGMQTFDQHLLRLYKSKVIDYETALNAASSPHDFQLMLRQSSIIKTPTKRYYGDWQKANE
jgi:twitching motility protein PilT